MRSMKKAFSLVLVVGLLLSLMVLPGSAASGISVSVDNKNVNAGDTFTVNVNITSNPGWGALTIDVYYKEDLLECTAAEAKEAVLGANGDAQKDKTKDNDMAGDGYKMAEIGSFSGKAVTATGSAATLTFRVKATKTSTTSLIVKVKEAVAEDGDTPLAVGTEKEGTISITGLPPVLTTVELSAPSAEANGTDNVTVTATAKDDDNVTMATGITWSVAPTGKGVTIAANGTITVGAKAEADSYTVTAKAGDKTKTATLTVTRAASVATKVEILSDGALKLPTDATPLDTTFSVKVTDQFGAEMTGQTPTWTITVPEGVTKKSDNVVSVTQDATVGAKVNVSVTVGGKTETKEFVVTQDPPELTSVTVTREDASAIKVPVKDATTTVNLTAVAKDQYSQEMENAAITWSGSATGVSVRNGVVTITPKAAAGTVTITATAKVGNVTKTGTIDLTIEKDPSIATTLELQLDGKSVGAVTKPGKNSKDDTFEYTLGYAVYDQYGDKMAEDPEAIVTYTLSEDIVGVEIKDGKLLVGKNAEGGTLTVTMGDGSLQIAVELTYEEAKTAQVVAPVGPSTKPAEPGATEPEPAQPTGVSGIFTDVDGSDWYLQAVQYVYDAGMMTGKDAVTFAPSAKITRAEVFVILARRAGVDTSGASVWYQKGLDWMVANGYSDGSDPNSNITREQLATLLYRQINEPGVSGDLTAYPDGAAVSDYAMNAMIWATQNGIIGGTPDGALNPQGNATRAEVATMLMRFCQQYPAQD